MIRHSQGTLELTADEVVIVLRGEQGLLRKRAWSKDLRLPREMASASWDGDYLILYNDGVAVQSLQGCRPEEAERVVAELGEAVVRPDLSQPAYMVRSYTSDKEYQRDADRLGRLGWRPTSQSGTDGHINVGRSLGRVALTGGLGLMLAGASRSKGKLTVTWTRAPQ